MSKEISEMEIEDKTFAFDHDNVQVIIRYLSGDFT